MIKLVFLIQSLNRGGAERQLVTLVSRLDKKIFDVTVLCFYRGGPFEAELKESGTRLIHLEKRGRWELIGFFRRLFLELKAIKPDVLHAYLGIPNLLTVFLKPFFPKTKTIWAVGASYIDWSQYGWLEALTFRLECLLARFADLIIINSNAGRLYHQRQGFPDFKMVTIPNGFDADQFRPDPAAGELVRKEWGVPANAILIGLVARLDPMKDHSTFLRAASILCQQRSDVFFVCVGAGKDQQKQTLCALADELNLSGRVIWAGARSDMAAVYNALDIATSSSYGEGLPNAIGETMACGVPCVVTNVGDSAWLVGESGIVVSPQDPEALAKGWVQCLGKNLKEAGLKARARIVAHFGVGALTEQTERVILSLVRTSLAAKRGFIPQSVGRSKVVSSNPSELSQ